MRNNDKKKELLMQFFFLLRKNNSIFLFILSVYILYTFTSCVLNNENGAKQDVYEKHAAYDFDGDLLEITWDFYWPKVDPQTLAQSQLTPGDGKIAAEINERFNVLIDGVHASNMNGTMKDRLDEGSLPDVFSKFWGGWDEIRECARSIPWDMIEVFAPRYAAMVKSAGGMVRETAGLASGEAELLYVLQKNDLTLRTFSVYRLDFLREAGFMPKGAATEIAERMYFTEESFTHDEFIEIMAAASDPEKDRYGLSLNAGSTERYTLMGMFGLNWRNVNENGRAVSSEGSEAFKYFLYFVETLRGLGAIKTGASFGVNASEYVWWTERIDNFAQYGLPNGFLGIRPEAELLITPPEIGPGGRRGTGDAVNLMFEPIASYVVNVNVTDEKLARILRIFDAVYFDPEMYALTLFGTLDLDFYWRGEPYESGVELISGSAEYAGHFNWGPINGIGGMAAYFAPDDALYRFASSPEALGMLLLPYKEDPDGVFVDERQFLYEKHAGARLDQICDRFLSDVISGKRGVDENWEEYYGELVAAGLLDWDELIGQYPVTNE